MGARNQKGQFTKGSEIKDLTGQRFGKLTVIKLDKVVNRRSYWIVKCDCGNVKSVRNDTLRVIKSCGCVKKEQDAINLRHGDKNHDMTGHPAFSIWDAMMNRCNNPNNGAFKDYGGRGISVCEEWHNPVVFCKWMDDNHFEKGLSIERIDVNGNYEPSNCKLIPRCEQAWNTRKTVYVEVDGEVVPLAKTARQLGISPCLAWHRWKRGIKDAEMLFYSGNLKDFHKEVLI